MDHIRRIVASTKEWAKGQDIACGKEISDLDKHIAALQQQRRQAVEASLFSELGDTPFAWERLPKRLKCSKNNVLAALYKEIAALQLQRLQAVETKRVVSLISELGGAWTWEALPEPLKYSKSIVLAALCGNRHVPFKLRERNWSMSAPYDVKDDREILIARASNPLAADCETYFRPPITTFTVPEPFLGDLEVLRAIAKPYPSALLNPGIPSTIFDDDGILLAFLNRTLERDDTSNGARNFRIALEHVLARFSLRIRSNAQFMIQAASVGFNVFPYIAGGLKSDKGVCLELARVSDTKIPDDVLMFLSESLKTDRDIILSFVTYNGFVIQHASLEHRQDLEIVRAASTCRAAALLYGSEKVKERLCCDKEFIGEILARKIRCYQPGHFPGLYTMLSDGLKLDLDIIAAARKGHCLDISDLPIKLTQDPQFWKKILAKSYLFWKDLPDAFRRDISIARCISGFPHIDMVMEVVNLHPSLAVDVAFWCNSILGCTSEQDIVAPELDIVALVDLIGSDVRNNRTVMLRACSRSCDLLPLLSRDFQIEREFVEEAVRHNDDALVFISREAQLLYPDLTAMAISSSYYDHTECIEGVHPELWSNLVVAEAWFRRDGPIHDSIPTHLKADPAYCMLILEHCFESARGFVAESLTSNKQFMMRAIEKNPSVYVLAPESLMFDFDLVLAGFGSPQSDCLVDHMVANGFPPCVHDFLLEVRRKLQSHEGFHSLLFGMSACSGSDCQLRKLGQGQETSIMLKRRIADFLGCPLGGEVAKHRRAAEALARFPAPAHP